MEQERTLHGVDDLVDAEEHGKSGTLAVLAKAEINQQIATAKAYPRSVTEFLREAEQLVTLNPEMARQCVYALPRGGKTIEGPSARFAEIIVYSFRNMRFGARPVLEEDEFITSQGVAYDLERNNGVAFEVRRRITDRDGGRFNADMIGVTSNAASSIALRNAVLKIIPKALWNPLYQKARQTIMGDYETFNNRLGKMFDEFQRYGVTKEMICAKLQKKGVADIKIDDMVTLAGMMTALQDGDTTAEQLFAQVGGEIKEPEERKPTAEEQKAIDARKAELARQAEEQQKKATEQQSQQQQPPQEPAKKTRRKSDAPTPGQGGGGPAGSDLLAGSGGSGGASAAPTPAQTGAVPQGQGGSGPSQPANGGDKLTANMVKQISLRCEAYDIDMAKFLGHFGVNTINDIPANRVNEALGWIEKHGQS